MKAKKVLSFSALPSRLPIWQTATCWLMSDRLHAAGWVWGVLGSLMALLWMGSIAGMIREEQVDLKELQ
jgi:hypothetical protein